MIQQQHLTEFPKQELSEGKKVTIPGLGVDIKKAMEQYLRGSLVERAKGFYESKGMIIPDFHKMDKIEKLLALNEFRKRYKDASTALGKAASASIQRLSNQKKSIRDESKPGESKS